MSLTSLADAPLLSKPAVGPGLSFPRSRPRPATKLKDQAAIDALFQEEDNGIQGELHVERKKIPPSRETPNSTRNLDTIFNTGEVDIPTQHVVPLPTLLPFNQKNVDSAKNSRQPKQDGAVFSRSKDPHDVLAGFLADSSTDLNVNECSHLEEENKSQRDEFKSKWNSYSPQPPGRLPTLAYSARHSLESTVSARDVSHSSTSPNKMEDDRMVFSKKDERWDTIEDVLSLLPDESRKSSNKIPLCENASSAGINSSQNLDEEKSEFGEYRPSCLSLSKSNHAIQRRHLSSFFSSSESLDSINKKSEISEKKPFSSISSEGSIKQGLQQKNGSSDKDDLYCHNDVSTRQPSPAHHSTMEKNLALIDSCSLSPSKEVLAQEKPGSATEIRRLRDENIALREEIMRIESEKLKIEKAFSDKELSYEAQVASMEKQEVQQIADELTSELMTVKQNLVLTEEKIESIRKAHVQEVDMLKNMHMRELEARDQQLHTERALLAEKKSAMEAFSQLLLKADEWSAKIDQLHKSMVCEKELQITERPNWIVNIESMASEHESSLQVLEKRSTEVCSQLEKVAATLEYARKDMEKLQNQEEERMNKTHDQLQALQEILKTERGQLLDVGTASREKLEQIHNLCSQEEKTLLSKFFKEQKDLEVEREAVLLMKEQISQVDAALREQLFEHAFRMQTEAEEMARQKSELEQAKEIAAEIALEVENSRRELEMYKTALNKTIPEDYDCSQAHGKDLHDGGFPEAHIATKRLFNLGRKEETVEVSRRRDQFQRPCCSADLSIDSLHGLDLLSRIESPQPEGFMMREEEKDMCYIKAQEEFLILAEKDLENMECTSLDEICMPRLLSF